MLRNLVRKPKHLLAQQLKPARDPHWRFGLAADYAETRHDPEVRADPWIGPTSRALSFINSNVCTPELRPFRRAIRIWRANRARRWELEARILADQPRATIAEVMQLPPSVIETYEAVFFDVRAALAKRDYIVCTVLQPWLSFQPADVARIWRHYGYWGGTHPLEALIDHFRRRGWKDYEPILSERPSRDRSPSDVAIERNLLLALLPAVMDRAEEKLCVIAQELLEVHQASPVTPADPPDIPQDLVAEGERLLADAFQLSRPSRKVRAG